MICVKMLWEWSGECEKWENSDTVYLQTCAYYDRFLIDNLYIGQM